MMYHLIDHHHSRHCFRVYLMPRQSRRRQIHRWKNLPEESEYKKGKMKQNAKNGNNKVSLVSHFNWCLRMQITPLEEQL